MNVAAHNTIRAKTFASGTYASDYYGSESGKLFCIPELIIIVGNYINSKNELLYTISISESIRYTFLKEAVLDDDMKWRFNYINDYAIKFNKRLVRDISNKLKQTIFANHINCIANSEEKNCCISTNTFSNL
jgi:hypothetical protein